MSSSRSSVSSETEVTVTVSVYRRSTRLFSQTSEDMETALSWLDDELLALNNAEQAMSENDIGKVMISASEPPPLPQSVTENVTRSQARELPRQTQPLTDANHNVPRHIHVKKQKSVQKEKPKVKPEPEEVKSSFPTLQLEIEDNVESPNKSLQQNGDMSQYSVSSKPLGMSTTSADTSKNQEDELDFYTKSLINKMNSPGDKDMYGYCGKCNGIVEGEKTGCTAMEKIFHVDCFRCKTCEKLLHGSQFYVVDKDAFCETCYINSLEKCTVCSEVITDRILRATGKPYHPACFKCVVCGKCLDGVPFTVDVTNQIHCVEDFHKKFAPKCSVCNNPIMPEPEQEETVRIVALDRSFHVDCYKCEKCGTKLSSEKEGKGCFPLDGHILCRDCNTAMVQELSRKI